mgnify:CR=1 FL=1
MCEGGLHWTISSAAGFVITGQYRPICSLSQSLPDCAPRRAFERAMERAFAEPGHCARVHRVWLLGRLLRG